MARPALKIDLRTVSLLAAQWTLLAGNVALYAAHALPLWAHMAITLVAIHLAFTIWHEAAHGTIANRRWLNDAAGILGMFPYTTPLGFCHFCLSPPWRLIINAFLTEIHALALPIGGAF